jgi:hypothetical protein
MFGTASKMQVIPFSQPDFSEFRLNGFQFVFWFPPALSVVKLKLFSVSSWSSSTTIAILNHLQTNWASLIVTKLVLIQAFLQKSHTYIT